MTVRLRSILEAIFIVIITIFWCEFAYYHYVFYFYCSDWPGMKATNYNHGNLTKLLVISDTHIMGPIKSFKIDKWRREWQMKQAFSISSSIYKPDVVVFMGDLLDEGLISHDALFKRSCKEFEEIFSTNGNGAERIIIPGNHDVGFHDRMIYFPFLIQRFKERFKTTFSVDLIRTRHAPHLNLVISNSMSLYNDSCPFCRSSLQDLDQLELQLNQIRTSDPNNYSPPIFLGHIPLYRNNDSNCLYQNSMKNRDAKANLEGKDVLHFVSSQAIKAKIQPRLAISGHTHMRCLTNHQISHDPTHGFQEITVTSYNHKYAEIEPGFLLLTLGLRQYHFKHCNLISEMVVVTIYISTLFLVLFRLSKEHRRTATIQVVSDRTGRQRS